MPKNNSKLSQGLDRIIFVISGILIGRGLGEFIPVEFNGIAFIGVGIVLFVFRKQIVVLIRRVV